MVMRKQYVKPEMFVVEISISSMLAASFTIDKNSQGDCEEDFARGRRGVWGDLWADDVEEK